MKSNKRNWFGYLLFTMIIFLIVGCGSPEEGGEEVGAEETDAGETINELTTDVLVIGGGGAGLAAATSAAENDSDVILVDKAAYLGGNTIIAGGAFNAVNPEKQQNVEMTDALMNDLIAILDEDESEYGDFEPTLVELKEQVNEYLESGNTEFLFDSVELHMIHTYLGGRRSDLDGETITGDVELVRTMAENGLSAIEWLESYGLEFGDGISTVLGALWPRTNSAGSGGSYIDTLESASRELGVEVMTETRADELIFEDGRVVGALVETVDGTTVTIYAEKGVVMATGGFGENPEMRAEYNTYWSEMPLDMPSTNSPNITGDGIIMGQEVGANLVGMGFIQLMPSSHPVTGSLFSGVWGSAETQVFVNKEGRRFVDEYSERDVLAAAALEQEDGLFFIITDQEIVGDRDIDQMLENGDVIQADTLEELAEQIEVDVDNFIEEIEKYNSYVDDQHDPDFNKPNFGEYKVDTEPFYATPRSPSVHHTMGGLQIDTSARVINEDGEVIPGFFAAGEVTGGIHAGNRLGGNAQTDIIVFGRIAGENAALEQ